MDTYGHDFISCVTILANHSDWPLLWVSFTSQRRYSGSLESECVFLSNLYTWCVETSSIVSTHRIHVNIGKLGQQCVHCPNNNKLDVWILMFWCKCRDSFSRGIANDKSAWAAPWFRCLESTRWVPHVQSIIGIFWEWVSMFKQNVHCTLAHASVM